MHKRHESLDSKKKGIEMIMRRTMTDKINKNLRKFENFYKTNTEIQTLKEKHNKELLDKHENVHQRVKLFFDFSLRIYY